MSLVSIGLVTWNSAPVLDACLAAVRRQRHVSIELLVADNASADDTRAILERSTSADERLWLATNVGFSAAHNRLITRSRGDYYLALNPDVVLADDFVEQLVAALAQRPDVGSASGKLLRTAPPDIIDSTGIVMLPSQRHVDRGADQRDVGQFDRPDEIFGPSGAAGFYRRAMLDDICVHGEYFDEDFFAYREDADLAWRARLYGWRSVYVPQATARHVRRVTPERRAALSADVNRYSVRNRFLLRLKNQPFGHALRFVVPALVRDLQVVGYVVLREWSSLPGLVDVVRLLPRTLAKRHVIQRRRRISSRELSTWFTTESVRSIAPSALR